LAIETFNIKKHSNILPKHGKVLIAPLNWGIGHATRCIPIIEQLIEHGLQPVLASDGVALQLLRKVFPTLTFYELPSYSVTYAKNSFFFKTKLLFQFPKFISTYKKEKKIVNEIIAKEKISLLISDNRFGVFHKEILSIYITHQINVKSGITTFFTSKIHQRIIAKYTECWVPDSEKTPNLGGQLSHNSKLNNIKYIGILSQFKRQILPIKYDILLLLSGPEPQRTLLEEKLLIEFSNSTKIVCLVKGIVERTIKKTNYNNITIYNYLFGEDLQTLLNESELVIARSGYSTIMDLAVLQKKAFFIPTPGQSEQLYLAEHLKKQRIASFALQNNFHVKLLEETTNFKGF